MGRQATQSANNGLQIKGLLSATEVKDDMKAKSKTTAKTGKVSPRKRATQRISYLSSLIDNISDAWISTDLDFNILEWNLAARSMYGWEAAEVIGHPLGEFMQSDYEGITWEAAIKTVLEK